ncbi:MAG TPA: hypothetical protein VMT99_03765 [Candidatus Paceibacterota bacterium]|nr:hypothetical protein [Candidatus Paceibacterota bacterium]
MQELISQLGIDWHLLISQAVNFALLLIALRAFAYKPLLALMRERRERIEAGLEKAAEADRRLVEADAVRMAKIREGEGEAVAILKRTETRARELEERMLAEARRKEAEELAAAQARLKSLEEESRQGMEQEAVAMIRRAIAKTVELAPKDIDDALIARAVKEAGASQP